MLACDRAPVRSNYSIIDPTELFSRPTVYQPRLCEQSPQAPLSAEASPPDSSEGHTWAFMSRRMIDRRSLTDTHHTNVHPLPLINNPARPPTLTSVSPSDSRSSMTTIRRNCPKRPTVHQGATRNRQGTHEGGEGQSVRVDHPRRWCRQSG